MNYTIITENDESDWDDKTGISYHYPNKYVNVLVPGTKVIYYKGQLKKEEYSDKRISDAPHYFGVGIIGNKEEDFIVKKGKTVRRWHCDIREYRAFNEPVLAKTNSGEFLEQIPESKKNNYWWDGVRVIDKDIYDKIISLASIEPQKSLKSIPVEISISNLETIFSEFSKFHLEVHNSTFEDFNAKHFEIHESYKSAIREESLKILDIKKWSADLIGNGTIVSKIIQCIELPTNNLVGNNPKYGEESMPHYKLLQSAKDGTNLADIEQIIYNHFVTELNPEVVFEQMCQLFGKKSALIAFLYYLKNDRRYLPISTKYFQEAFILIGSDLNIKKSFSWERYSAYLNTIKLVKNYLETKLKTETRLVDAHSFLFTIVYNKGFIKWRSSVQEQIKFEAFEVNPVNNSGESGSSKRPPRESNSDVDWEQKDRDKRITGRLAEEMVLKFEEERLNEEGYSHLVKKIKDVSKKLGRGYDILSYSNEKTERHIEVKASNGNSFIITGNELRISQNDKNYWIYIVAVKEDKVVIKMVHAPKLEDNSKFKLDPKDYYVSFSIDS